MGLRDKLHHHHHTSKVDPLTSERAGLAAENPNNPAATGMTTAPGVAPLPVVMPGTAAGYTKPVYVPLDSLPQGTRVPINQGGPHVYNEHGEKHTVDAAVAATVEAMGGPAVNTHGDPHVHDPNNPERANVVTRRGNVGVAEAANPVLIPGMSTANGVGGFGTAPVPAPAPVPKAAPVPVPVPAPVPVKEVTPVPVVVPEQPRSVTPVPAPVPVATEHANLPPAGHAHHDIPLTATGPVSEIVDEPTRNIQQIPGPDAVPATEVPRAVGVPPATPPVAGTGSLPTMVAHAIEEPEVVAVAVAEKIVEPVAAPAKEQAVEPVAEKPREVSAKKVEPVAPQKPKVTHPAGAGIKPAGVTQPIDVVHDVAGGHHAGTDNDHSVSVHDQPKTVDAGAI